MAFDKVSENLMYDDFTFDELENAFSELLEDHKNLLDKYKQSRKEIKAYTTKVDRLSNIIKHIKETSTTGNTEEIDSQNLIGLS